MVVWRGYTLNPVDIYIDRKIKLNSNIIIFTYYELRVKLNLYESETKEFLDMCEDELEDLGYSIYYTGEKYFYDNKSLVVKENQLMVAIKKK